MQPVNKPHFGTIVNQCKSPPPLSPIPSPLPSARLHWRSPAGSEPAPRLKSSPRKRTRMTWIGRIFTDIPIRVNPRNPCNPCSTSALLLVDAPEIRNAMYLQFAQTTNLRSSCRNPAGSRLRTHVCPQAYVYTPSRGATLGAFICGSFFAGAPDINYCEFIKVWASPKSSPQSHHIPPTSSSKHSTLLSERRLNAARKTKYAFLQLFNSKIDKKGDNENI